MADPEEAIMVDKKQDKKKMVEPPWMKKGTMKKGK